MTLTGITISIMLGQFSILYSNRGNLSQTQWRKQLFTVQGVMLMFHVASCQTLRNGELQIIQTCYHCYCFHNTFLLELCNHTKDQGMMEKAQYQTLSYHVLSICCAPGIELPLICTLFLGLYCNHIFIEEYKKNHPNLELQRKKNLSSTPLSSVPGGLRTELTKDRLTGKRHIVVIDVNIFMCMGASQKRSENPEWLDLGFIYHFNKGQ